MMKTTHMKYMGYAIAAAVLLLYGCVSERDTVSVRQVESKAFIVLRAGEGRKNIFSLKYPLAFEFRKNAEKYIILIVRTLRRMMNCVPEPVSAESRQMTMTNI